MVAPGDIDERFPLQLRSAAEVGTCIETSVFCGVDIKKYTRKKRRDTKAMWTMKE